MTGNIAQLLTPHRADPARILYRHHTGTDWEDVTVADIAREVGRWQAALPPPGTQSR